MNDPTEGIATAVRVIRYTNSALSIKWRLCDCELVATYSDTGL